MTTYYVDGALGNDSNAGTSAGAGNAWLTIAKAFATVAIGDIVNVKGGTAYAISAGLTWSGGGGYQSATRVEGYTTTPGDGGKFTVNAIGTFTGLTLSADGCRLVGMILDGTLATGVGVTMSSVSSSNTLINCIIRNWSSTGISIGGAAGNAILGCEVSGCAGNGGVYLSATNVPVYVRGCRIHDNTVAGINAANYSLVATRNLIWGNTGGSSDGILIADSYECSVVGNTIHNNGRDGLRMTSYFRHSLILDNLFTLNGGYGINPVGLTAGCSDPAVDYNWFGSGGLANTSGARGATGLTASPHDLSGDPQYVDASTGDFTPQNALVRAASDNGWIGAVQPTPSGGSAGMLFVPNGEGT